MNPQITSDSISLVRWSVPQVYINIPGYIKPEIVYKNNKNNTGTVCPKKSHIRFPHNYWVSNSIAACYVAKAQLQNEN